jgi:hypothetical protein
MPSRQATLGSLSRYPSYLAYVPLSPTEKRLASRCPSFRLWPSQFGTQDTRFVRASGFPSWLPETTGLTSVRLVVLQGAPPMTTLTRE